MKVSRKPNDILLGVLIFAVCIATPLAGCGGGSDTEEGTGGSAGTGSSCPDAVGTWEITGHCQTTLIGQNAVITQTGCDVTVSSPVAGQTVTGSVNRDGTLALEVQPDDMTCSGTIASDSMTLDCSGCPQTLERL